MSTSTHNRNSSGDTVKVGPIRKGKKILTFNSDDDSVAKLRQNVLSTASCTDVNINTTLAEERDTIDESRLKPVPLRNFIVGNKSSTNVRPNNGFLRSGYTGCLRKVRSTPNFDMHSKELMKTGVGKELREEDTKYGRNMVKALSSRGHIMGKKLLFLGSGCAKVINFFFARGPQSAVCVDTSPIKIARLRENTELLGYSSFVSSICCSATDVDAYVSCGETFDTIIITKAMGAICSNSQKTASDILAVAKSILSEDGVIFVDSQTGDLGTRGKLSEFFGSKDAGVATIWGRYDDNVYNVHECAETASLTVREQFKLNIRKSDGHLKDCAAQIWVGYIVGKRRDVHVPLVPKVSKNQKVIKLKDFDLVMKGGIDMLPKGTNGVKLVPWQGVSLQVTQFPIYPKFDGIAGVLICSDGMATFSSSVVTMALGVTKTKNDYLFLSELCRVSIENHKPHWVPVILGIISINGVKYDPNDMSVLERERSEFEDYYSRHGILVTGPNMLFSLKGDTIRHQCETKDSRKRVMEIPVDGLNVFIGGGHGNFLKPISRITLDIDSESTRNFYDAMKLIDSDDFDLPEVREGVWEYRLEGMDFVPFRRRTDKVTGNGTIRTAQDINSLIKTSELFSYVKDTSGLYTYLIDTFNTYQPTREEDKKFFTDNYFK